jgi:acyl carrier protein
MLSNEQLNNSGTTQLTKTESIISGIWSEVLQQNKINPEDNFFELGGDSLMTMMVMFRVKDMLNIDMPPYTISQSPTLREFCEKIDEQMSGTDTTILPEEGFDAQELESGVI